MFIHKRKITAAEEVEEIEEKVEEEVEVAADVEDIVFSVGEDEFTVTPDEDAEYVESSKRVRGQKVCAGRKIAKKVPVKSSKTVRKIAKK